MTKPASGVQIEYNEETKQFRVSPQAYARMLQLGFYDPKRPMAYLDYVRRTGNKSKRK